MLISLWVQRSFNKRKIKRRNGYVRAENDKEASESIKVKEHKLSELQELRDAVITYQRTRKVFGEYKAAHYSNQYLEEHWEEITFFRAAQDVFRKYKIEKFPKVNDVSAEYMQVLSEKRAEYAVYKEKKQQMQELLKAQKNVEMILDLKEEKSEHR